jgi:hypothetical protein
MEKKSVGLLELETAVLECFLEKTPFNPLGVKIIQMYVKITNNMVFCSFLFVDVFEAENWDFKRLRYVPTSNHPTSKISPILFCI